jgi:hypothetical protein
MDGMIQNHDIKKGGTKGEEGRNQKKMQQNKYALFLRKNTKHYAKAPVQNIKPYDKKGTTKKGAPTSETKSPFLSSRTHLFVFAYNLKLPKKEKDKKKTIS